MFVSDNIPMSSTRKYRQNGEDINKTLLNEKRNIAIKHFEFSYFVNSKAAVTDRSFKNCFMLSVRVSSYGCTREVWRARKKRKSCSRR